MAERIMTREEDPVDIPVPIRNPPERSAFIRDRVIMGILVLILESVIGLSIIICAVQFDLIYKPQVGDYLLIITGAALLLNISALLILRYSKEPNVLTVVELLTGLVLVVIGSFKLIEKFDFITITISTIGLTKVQIIEIAVVAIGITLTVGAIWRMRSGVKKDPIKDNNLDNPTVIKLKENKTVLSAILIIILVSLLMILSASSYQDTGIVPAIWAKKGSNSSDTYWTVTSITTGGQDIAKSDVYIQTRYSNGTFQLASLPILYASGTHGFNYSAVSTGAYLSIGDIFRFNRSIYAPGSEISLVNEGEYCHWTV